MKRQIKKKEKKKFVPKLKKKLTMRKRGDDY